MNYYPLINNQIPLSPSQKDIKMNPVIIPKIDNALLNELVFKPSVKILIISLSLCNFKNVIIIIFLDF